MDPIVSNQNEILLAISILFLVGGAVFLVLKRLRLRRARTWPTESGRVESTNLRLEPSGAQQSAWVAVVTYSYAVQGATYSGYLRKQFMTKGRGEKWIGKYTQNLPLTIRYNPAKANDSVLFEKENLGVIAS